ncbi:Ubiquitin system component CUE [Dillenia turbinata]|uniref:Ubiquitin system component CUE n=1 Tax=Dillenia turbinata TaxID=194707 RepID=A0AAN8ZLI5_9MAGN
MSSRYPQSHNNRQHDGKHKSQKKFVPKTQSYVPTEPNSNSNPNPKLTSSLRRTLSQQSESPSAGAGAETSATSGGAGGGLTSRVKLGDKGEWVSNRTQGSGNFVNYLPQDEAVASGLSAEEGALDPVESQRVVDLLNRELSKLLRLKPRDFWKEVARDASLHDFLDSFLKFRSRWYDFPHRGAKGIVAGVIVGEIELSRRVFMVLYRISSNRDPGAPASDGLSSRDHAGVLSCSSLAICAFKLEIDTVLSAEKNLLDLPKLLDICALYGRENEELTRKVVMNALQAQPWLHDNITAVVSHFLSIVHKMHEQCSSSLEVLLSSGGLKDHGSTRLHVDLLEVMDFINDAIVTMDAFTTVYKSAALLLSSPVKLSFGDEELLSTLVRMHDLLIPSLQRGFRCILTTIEDGFLTEMLPNIAISLKMLSMRIVNFGWKLLDACYLSDEVFESGIFIPAASKMFPANVEDPVIRADILVQTFRELNGISRDSLENQNWGTFLQNVEKNHTILGRIDNLRNAGWILMDDEQFQYLLGIMVHPDKANGQQPHRAASVATSTILVDENVAITESKISQIKDLFPNYGKGFLHACLEAYNQSPEEVIQRILEGTLHEDLLSLDTSVENIPPPPKSASVGRNDKGKGKLIESVARPPADSIALVSRQETVGSSLSSSSSIGRAVGSPVLSSSSSTGRYVRKSTADLPDHATLDSKDKDLGKVAKLVSQYEYEDEYDDSFDDLGFSVVESASEEPEALGDGTVLKLSKSWGAESGASSSSHSKWNSRKKPQFYVKDGKNYSYKVEGSVAVSNSSEATLVTQAQKELIHGLGRGGNLPLGAVKKLMDSNEEHDDESDVSGIGGRGTPRNQRGRGRREGRNRYGQDSNEERNDESNGATSENTAKNQRGRGRREGRNRYGQDSNEERNDESNGATSENTAKNQRGRGRREGRNQYGQDSNEEHHDDSNGGASENQRGRGRRGSGGRNHYRKDRAMKKHFSGLGGY